MYTTVNIYIYIYIYIYSGDRSKIKTVVAKCLKLKSATKFEDFRTNIRERRSAGGEKKYKQSPSGHLDRRSRGQLVHYRMATGKGVRQVRRTMMLEALQRIHVRRYEHRITVAVPLIPARLLQRVHRTAPGALRRQVQRLRRDPDDVGNVSDAEI